MTVFLIWALIVMPVSALLSCVILRYALDWLSRKGDRLKQTPVPLIAFLLDRAEGMQPVEWLLGGVIFLPLVLLLLLAILRLEMKWKLNAKGN